MKRNWIRGIIGGLSFTSALFVFQACYGTPQDIGLDILVSGHVKSKSSGLPIEGIKVSVTNNMQYEMTDENGHFSMYTEMFEHLRMNFEDIDSTANGYYASKDTVLNNVSEDVFLEISLEDK
jgi:putative lipoprotein (rSAM/lipoprotein system)